MSVVPSVCRLPGASVYQECGASRVPEHLGMRRTSRRFQVWVLSSGLWVGSEAGTYHITSCTVGPIFTGPTAGLNATPALGRAPLPRSPACPEHVWWAEQMFIAVSVRRKSKGKGDCLVPLEATRHVASHPCA